MVRYGSIQAERSHGAAADSPSDSTTDGRPSQSHSRTSARASSTGAAKSSHDGRCSRPGELSLSGGISEASGDGRSHLHSASETGNMSETSRDLSMSGLARGSFLPAPPFDPDEVADQELGASTIVPHQRSRIPACPMRSAHSPGHRTTAGGRRVDGRTRILIQHMRMGLPQTHLPRPPRRARSRAAKAAAEASAHAVRAMGVPFPPVGADAAPRSDVHGGSPHLSTTDSFAFTPFLSAPAQAQPAFLASERKHGSPVSPRRRSSSARGSRERVVSLSVPEPQPDGRDSEADKRDEELAAVGQPVPRNGPAQSVHWRRLSSMKSLSRMGTVSFMHGMAVLGGRDDEELHGEDEDGDHVAQTDARGQDGPASVRFADAEGKHGAKAETGPAAAPARQGVRLTGEAYGCLPWTCGAGDFFFYAVSRQHTFDRPSRLEDEQPNAVSDCVQSLKAV